MRLRALLKGKKGNTAADTYIICRVVSGNILIHARISSSEDPMPTPPFPSPPSLPMGLRVELGGMLVGTRIALYSPQLSNVPPQLKIGPFLCMLYSLSPSHGPVTWMWHMLALLVGMLSGIGRFHGMYELRARYRGY